jgi:hypothetical protein
MSHQRMALEQGTNIKRYETYLTVTTSVKSFFCACLIVRVLKTMADTVQSESNSAKRTHPWLPHTGKVGKVVPVLN